MRQQLIAAAIRVLIEVNAESARRRRDCRKTQHRSPVMLRPEQLFSRLSAPRISLCPVAYLDTEINHEEHRVARTKPEGSDNSQLFLIRSFLDSLRFRFGVRRFLRFAKRLSRSLRNFARAKKSLGGTLSLFHESSNDLPYFFQASVSRARFANFSHSAAE